MAAKRSSQHAGTPRYLDLLDTVRTRRLEDHRVAKANLMIACLRDEPIVVSQTQAFDSSVILEGAEGVNGPDFRQVVADRTLIIKLLPGVRDVDHAFANALERYIDPPAGDISRRFVFSAWPIDDVEIAKTIRSALAEGHDRGLPADLAQRLDAVRRLSSFLAQHRLAGRTKTPIMTLATRLALASERMPETDELHDLRVILNVLVASGVSERAALYRTVRDLSGPRGAKASLYDLVSLCYNDVVAASLDAEPIMLASRSQAVAVWASSEVGAATPMATIETGPYRALEPLTWRKLGAIRDEVKRIDDPKERGDLLATVLAEELLPHDIVVRLVSVAEALGGAGAVAIGGLAGAALLATAAPVGLAAGAIGATALSTWLAHRLHLVFGRARLARIETRFRGLRQER